MRLVERPLTIKVGGKVCRVFGPDAELARVSTLLQVRHGVKFALCQEPEQRMLLAVASVADEFGLASGLDEETGTVRGVSVPVLALKAGLGRAAAEQALARLVADGILIRLDTNHPGAKGPVWVVPDYEENELPDDAETGLAVLA
ncbi:hypothetical protein ABH924_004352 [Arthrobacter sp. GAS37]|uniref:hypothetical protein n=1 Tax=Arthrobacter sp. GAS37 TaxID=3156261 RepID=UPI003833B81B